jgi:hypothetical protein
MGGFSTAHIFIVSVGVGLALQEDFTKIILEVVLDLRPTLAHHQKENDECGEDRIYVWFANGWVTNLLLR